MYDTSVRLHKWCTPPETRFQKHSGVLSKPNTLERLIHRARWWDVMSCLRPSSVHGFAKSSGGRGFKRYWFLKRKDLWAILSFEVQSFLNSWTLERERKRGRNRQNLWQTGERAREREKEREKQTELVTDRGESERERNSEWASERDRQTNRQTEWQRDCHYITS